MRFWKFLKTEKNIDFLKMKFNIWIPVSAKFKFTLNVDLYFGKFPNWRCYVDSGVGTDILSFKFFMASLYEIFDDFLDDFSLTFIFDKFLFYFKTEILEFWWWFFSYLLNVFAELFFFILESLSKYFWTPSWPNLLI